MILRIVFISLLRREKERSSLASNSLKQNNGKNSKWALGPASPGMCEAAFCQCRRGAPTEVVALQGRSPSPPQNNFKASLEDLSVCQGFCLFGLCLCVCVCEQNVYSTLLSLKKVFNENFLIPSSQAPWLGPVLFLSCGRQLHLSQ